MASGKQLSFEYGEVAPSQHYKSDAISYAQGLRRLRNMFVRRDGGISNRSGFRLWEPSEYQYDVTSLHNIRRIRTFVYAGIEYTVVAKADRNYLYVDGSEISSFFYEGSNHSGGVLVPPSPSDVKFIPTKDGVFIAPQCTFSGCTVISYGGAPNDFDINTMSANVFIQNARAYVVQRYEKLGASYSGTKGFTGASPFLPVSYLVTATMRDGREVRVHTDQSTGFSSFSGGSSDANPGGNALCYPHAELTSNVALTFSSATDLVDVKFFNLYRAAGQEGVGQSFFKLAGRVNNGGGAVFSFTDYGADDPTITPPLDMTYFLGSAFHTRIPFSFVEQACFYQQRLIMSGANIPNLKIGEALVSAIGAPRQVSAPLITSDLGAFNFSVPITDGSAIAGYLAMERALIGTGKGVYIVRGGQQGILTPATVNPLKISDEGWSSSVEATMNGSRGFWINAAKTKLMAAEFGDDGNVSVGEASLLSNHFLKQGIVQMESIGGEDNSVYLVTRDGKLVRATVGDGGVFGFSLYETEGFVESVFRNRTSLTAPDGSGSITPEVLFAYVIRNGYRFKERIEVREDRYRDQELFADCSIWFGTKLSVDNMNIGAPGYIKTATWVPWSEWYSYDPFGMHINVEPPVSGSHSWQANETIKIRSNVDLLDAFQDQDFVLHFYYDEKDSDGNFVLDDNGRKRQKSLRYIIDQNVTAVATGETVSSPWAYTALAYEFEGYFTADVPTELRNVRGSFTTADYEFFLYQTRWAPAFQYFRVPVADDILNSPLKAIYTAANEGEVTVVAEGEILSSPLNPNRETMSITVDGSDYLLEFGDYYSWGYVGIPYTSEVETLDIETGDNRTLTDAKKLINKVGFGVVETRGGFFGMPGKTLDQMEEKVFRQDGDITQQTQNVNGHMEVSIPAEWTEGGRVSIKNVDPVPMTILSVYPKGLAGD